MGLRCLRHIERTRVLVFVVDVAGGHPEQDYQQLRTEVGRYNEEMLERPRVVVLNKVDLLKGFKGSRVRGFEGSRVRIRERGGGVEFELDVPCVRTSALRREGIEELEGWIERECRIANCESRNGN